jgi:hypothetical protein
MLTGRNMAFKKRTIFILGAGASAEVKMPVGSKLKEAVAGSLNFRRDRRNRLISGDGDLLDALKLQFGNDAKRYIDAGAELARAMPVFVSIDEAIHFYSGNAELVRLGKSEIIRQIIRSEGSSALKLNPATGRPALERIRKTWYPEFLSMALAGLRKDELESAFQNVTLVNFNYDRTLEQYLYWALQTTAGITADNAAQVIAKLDVIRPYGCVGGLEWQQQGGSVPFGDSNQNHFLLIEGIRTYTEQHQQHIPARIATALDQSELVILLGFGFHAQNMELLKPTNPARGMSGRRAFATVMGIDQENHPSIRNKFLQCFGGASPTILVDWPCWGLLTDLRLSILAD